MTENIQCIYCKEDKPASAYKKVEHVIPQSFGKFINNFTLRQLVCDACNQFFGDRVELALARDTLEGQSRSGFGD
jgi:HNH endonuclease